MDNKTLVIGDIHLNELYKLYITNVLFKYLELVVNTYTFDRVIFLGDIVDAPNMNNDVLKMIKYLLMIFRDKEIIILVGNHDKITKTESVFDVIILPTNVTIISKLSFKNNEIFLPHHYKITDITVMCDSVIKYINDTDYKKYYIYSHNDFSDIYKFKNTFVNITDTFGILNSEIYLINGHNHVEVFKKSNTFHILNIGCAINTTFNDTNLYNNFLIIGDNKTKLLKNKYSIQYFTFHVNSSDHIYTHLSTINRENLKFIKFTIHNPIVEIDENLRVEIVNNYNCIDLVIDYDIDIGYNDVDCDSEIIESNVKTILDKLNINMDEFKTVTNDTDIEKIEVLFSLLNIMFEGRNTKDIDKQRVINIIKKYIC